MQCPTCGDVLTPDSSTCLSCGAVLESIFLQAGTMLHGKYRLGQTLAHGGFGVTYQAMHTELGSRVAIKELLLSGVVRQGCQLLPSALLPSGPWEAAKQAFKQEGRILARFNHPSIVRVLDVFEENGTVYLVMEFLEGETLQQHLTQGKPNPPAFVEHVALAVLEALSVVHGAGMLHRDIKPDNVFLEGSGRVVLIDFGSARPYLEDQTVQHTRTLTPGYAPLEQYASAARFGPSTDLYSLGATLYHLVAGSPPPAATERSVGEPLPPLPAGTPPMLAKTILSCLALKVQDRPQQAHEILDEWQGAAGKPVPLPPLPKRASTGLGPHLLVLILVGFAAYLQGFFEEMGTFLPPTEKCQQAFTDERYLEALKVCKQASRTGDTTAGLRVGDLYMKGLGTAQSPAAAFAWYQQAALRNNAQAQFQLSQMHEWSSHDLTQAEWRLTWIQRSARLGHPEAQFQLGWMHLQGEGMPQDPAEAARWITRAARQGQGQAQLLLGGMLEEGVGVQQDLQAALHWYQAATLDPRVAREAHKRVYRLQRTLNLPAVP